MSFLSPQFLWGLLLAIPIVAVYLLKVKPRRSYTNAWFLWQKVLEEKQSSSLFSKLRSFLSLLLMLLMLLFICLGLSEPRFSDRDSRDVFIVIDQSASMQAGADGTTRLDLAKSEAHSIVNALSLGQKASVAVLNQSVEYLTHLSSNAQGLHQVIDGIGTSSLPDTAFAGMVLKQMANALEKKKDELRLIFISDGCNGFSLDKVLLIDQVIVGEKKVSENLGIIAADIQPLLGSKSASAMVQLINASDKVSEVELELYHEETSSIAELIKVTVDPGVNKPLFFELPDTGTGAWTARILSEDSLELDNTASMILRSLPSVSISIPAEDNYFYQRCVEAFSKTSGSLRLVESNSQLQIFHGSVPEGAVGDLLVFAPVGKSGFWSEIGEEVSAYLPIAEKPEHPLLKHIDLNQFSFTGAKRLTLPEEAQVIVESEEGVPLIYQVNKINQSVVVVNLDPQLNDFFLFTGFVALIYDSAMYLSGNEQRPPSVYPVGSEYTARSDSTVSTPSAQEIEFKKGAAHTLNELGFYTSNTGEEKDAFSSALLSSQESSLKAITERETEVVLVSGYPPSFWLVIAGLILLIIESMCYHRRKAD